MHIKGQLLLKALLLQVAVLYSLLVSLYVNILKLLTF